MTARTTANANATTGTNATARKYGDSELRSE
jgi:hypothetical protein